MWASISFCKNVHNGDIVNDSMSQELYKIFQGGKKVNFLFLLLLRSQTIKSGSRLRGTADISKKFFPSLESNFVSPFLCNKSQSLNNCIKAYPY